jgi:hypothetical protein
MSHVNDSGAGGERLPGDPDVLNVEREVLRAICLCQKTDLTPQREEQFCRLVRYRFRDVTHQMIFDTLCELFAMFADNNISWQENVREQLPRRLTLKGVPDVDLEPFLRPGGAEEGETQRHIRRLTAGDE